MEESYAQLQMNDKRLKASEEDIYLYCVLHVLCYMFDGGRAYKNKGQILKLKLLPLLPTGGSMRCDE